MVRFKVLRRLIMLSAVVVMVLAVAQPAEALKITTSGSYPGGTVLPVPLVHIDDGACGAGCIPFDNYYIMRSRRVTENYTYRGNWQYVCVTARLLHWSPLWIDSSGGIHPGRFDVSTTRRVCKYISPAQTSWQVPQLDLPLSKSDHALYAADLVVTWQLQSGYVLGRKIYDYNLPTDYTADDIIQRIDYTPSGHVIFALQG